MPVRDDYEFVHLSAAGTTVIAGVASKLIRIVVNTTANATVTVYNAATAAASNSSNIVGILKANIAEQELDYGIKVASGIVVAASGASDLTVVYANA